MELELTKEEQLLCARAAEMAASSEYVTAAMPFLTPRERLLVHDSLIRSGWADRAFFWGGCRGCERTMAVFPAQWRLSAMPPAPKGGYEGAFDAAREAYFVQLLADMPDLAEEIPLCALQITGSGFASLSHRDFMGAILGLGIERSVLGEIVVTEDGALVFTTPDMAVYLQENLRKIGRDTVKIASVMPDPAMEIPRKYETVSVTAATPRIDGVVRALTNLSREDAADLVRAGMVERNYNPVTDVDRQISPGDVLTIRGYGKYRIDRTDEETKRGRRRILCRKYM
ncbi:MAG: hypothetical protein IJ480_05955 [Clostridia bacterium]|nr:hypothetical protein [Clostridia bacterium]